MRSLLAFSLALLVLSWASPVRAQEETHEGKVVSVAGGKLTMTDKNGKNEHSHMVPSDATITCDGKNCMLDDLTKDCWVKITMIKKGDAMVVSKVEAKKSSS
jgi:hypothetical protein